MRVSTDVAVSMMESMGLPTDRPLACQVRLGGCKGMLVPWGINVMPPGLIQVPGSDILLHPLPLFSVSHSPSVPLSLSLINSIITPS